MEGREAVGTVSAFWRRSARVSPAAAAAPAECDPLNEFDRLVFNAAAAIRRTLRDGAAKYQPGEWKRHGVTEHLRHAADHSWDALRQVCMGGVDKFTDALLLAIDHAICRLAMLRSLLTRGDE